MQRPAGAPPVAEEQLVALADAEQPELEINAWHLLNNDPEDVDNVAAADMPQEAGNDDGNDNDDDNYCIFSDGDPDSENDDMDNDEQQGLQGQRVSYK